MQFVTAATSSLGKKYIMAVTGAILFLFIIGHLMGNLLIFAGPHAINAYAKKLIDMAPLLWLARIVLLSSIILHIWSAHALVIENRKARPVTYRKFKPQETSYAAQTMLFSGLIILAFVVYHLMHFTFRVTNPDISHLKDVLGYNDVYTMVVLSFQNFWISAFYVISLALLCFHLSHGFASMFQSVGLVNEKHAPALGWVSRGLAVLIFLGYISIPITCYLGFLKAGGVA